MIAILLSTYNGEKHLCEQLDSIIHQSYKNFRIYIRDDGSTDNTTQIIQEYERKYPQHIIPIRDTKGNIGVRKSFETLMKKAKADYYCFCDQDDYWEPEKLQVYVDALKKDIPHLFFCNMEVVDSFLNHSNSNFLKENYFSEKDIKNIMFRGYIPGCAMAFNDLLKQLYLSYEFKNGLHDTNIYILAQLLGYVNYTEQILIKYRIHDSNTIGKGKRTPFKILIKDLLKFIFNNNRYREIKLKDYFCLLESLRKGTNENALVKKEMFNKEEINRLSVLKRKRWYYKHFKPFHKGFLEGFVQVMCI